eukprot:10469229-Lingulodinium_polyedra.AAC.1
MDIRKFSGVRPCFATFSGRQHKCSVRYKPSDLFKRIKTGDNEAASWRNQQKAWRSARVVDGVAAPSTGRG